MAARTPVWEVRPRDFDFEARMARALGVHPAVASILGSRGLDTVESARAFLNPCLSDLHDPFLLPDMLAAATRIEAAIRGRETVLIHGDYDVDGITGTALLVRFLSKLGADVQYYIPHRMLDRYGLSRDAVRQGAKLGAALVIAVDCGVTGNEAVAEARRLGMDVVIIDHHEPGETLPDAVAIVDPKRRDATYPERELAAVGLCYKTASAICERMCLPQESLQRAFLDLVCLGTIADVVPLVGENRILASHGLKLLPQTRKVGLRALLQQCKVDHTARAMDVAFRIAPRMNAVGRMGDATDALDLLLTDDEDEARRLALHLESTNRERQREQDTTYRQALGLIDEQVDLENDTVVVLVRQGWHVGVVGIVAAKILERHGRPTILLAADGDEARGSARSVGGFDITGALEACSETLTRYGGHALAAGVTLQTDRVDELRKRLNEVAAETLTVGEMVPKVHMDAELLLDELDPELLASLALLEPFGQANPAPLFLTRGAEVLEARAVGREEQHLKLFVSQGDRSVDCIGFGMGQNTRWITRGMAVDICHTPEINEFNGTRGIQLRLEDVRPAQ